MRLACDKARQEVEESLAEVFGDDLNTLMITPGVTDIMINNDGSVFFEMNGQDYELGGLVSENRRRTIIRQAAHLENGGVVNDHEPSLSATLPNGVRLEAMLASSCVGGSAIVLRIPPTKSFTLDEWEADGRATAGQVTILRQALRLGLKIMVCGETGSGKTTMLSTLCNEPPSCHRRHVSIEDRPELILTRVRNKMMLVSTVLAPRRLVMIALRSYPKHVTFGEVRDGAAWDIVKAALTGHFVMWTAHADSGHDALDRMVQLSMEVVKAPPRWWVFKAVDLVVWMKKGRQVGRIQVPTEIDGERFVVRDARTEMDLLTLMSQRQSALTTDRESWPEDEELEETGSGLEWAVPERIDDLTSWLTAQKEVDSLD